MLMAGPLGTKSNQIVIDTGTLVRTASPLPGQYDRDQQRHEFEWVIKTIQGELANGAAITTWDPWVRNAYQRMIGQLALELRSKAAAGSITWADAAAQAVDARNTSMDVIRLRSHPVGRAIAEFLKKEGLSLNQLVAKYTVKLYGAQANFNALSLEQRNAVFAEVIDGAGRSNPRVNAWMARASRVGRGLVALSLAVAIYNISTSEDPVVAAEKEGAVLGAGILGGAAAGALAGLACGPGAPVCVGLGAFAGGALAAFGVDFLWTANH
jgi:hypothetical protein